MATTIGKLAAVLSLDSRRYESGLKKSGKATDRFTRKVNKSYSSLDNFGKLPAVALRAVSAFGGMELGLRGVESIAEAINGNFETSAELVKKLPAGVGPFASALDDVLGRVTGIKAEVSSLERAMSAMDLSTDLQFGIALRGVSAIDTLESSLVDLARKVELATAPKATREFIRQRQEAEKLVQTIESQIKAQRNTLRLTEKESKAIADAGKEISRLKRVIEAGTSSSPSVNTNTAFGIGGVGISGVVNNDPARFGEKALKRTKRELSIQQGIIDGILARQNDATTALDKLADRLRVSRDLLNSLTVPAAPAKPSGPTFFDDLLGLSLKLGDKLQGQIARQVKDLKGFSSIMFEQTRTPLERYEATLTKLSKSLELGIIDFDTYGRAVKMAKEQLEAFENQSLTDKLNRNRFSGAIERGSAEALELALSTRSRDGNEDKKIEKNTRDSYEELQRQTRSLEDLTQRQAVQVVAF